MSKQKLVIYGAGETGTLLAFEQSRGRYLQNYEIVGYIDDIITGNVEGLPVLGDRDSLPELRKKGIDNLVITMLEKPMPRLRECKRLEL